MKKQFVKKLSLVLLVTVILFSFSGCNIGKKKSSGDNNKISVAVIVPLTGGLSFAGDFVKKSMEMGIDTSKVSLFFEDSKGTAKDAVTATSKLINSNEIDIVVSMMTYISESINPICEQKNIPHFIYGFSPTITESSVAIRHFPSSVDEAKMYINYINENNYSDIVFFRHIEPDADWAYNNITAPQLLKNDSVELNDIAFNTNTKNFHNLATKLKQYNPELCIVQSYSFNFDNIISNLKSISYTNDILCDLNFVDVYNFSRDQQVKLEHIPFLGVTYVLNDSFAKYSKDYQEKYRSKPYVYGAFAYDLAILLNNLNDINLTKNSIIEYCETTNINGVSDRITYDKNGNLQIKYDFLEIVEGEFVKL